MDLKTYLTENGIKQRHIAEKCGVADSTIGNILKGKYKPSPNLARKIERVTEGAVTLEELLFPDEAKP